MLINQSRNVYNITLPPSTSKEVVEWFEIMENNNNLSEALIELVYERVKSGKSLTVSNSSLDNDGETPPTPNKQQISQGDFLDTLYNWQDSNHAIFLEEKEVKKEKRKMLSV